MNEQENLTAIAVENTQESRYHPLEKSDGALICIAALFAAVLYSLCFTGRYIHPSLSFTVFCTAIVCIFYLLCRALKQIKNKRGFLWALPILAVSLFNGVFQLSILSYFNVVAVHYMFAVMALKVTRDADANEALYHFFINVLNCIFNNVTKALPVFRLFIKKGQTNGRLVKVLQACVLSLPVVIVVFALLVNADQVFSFYAERFFQSLFSWNYNYISHAIVITLAAIYFTAYAYNLLYKKKNPHSKPKVPSENSPSGHPAAPGESAPDALPVRGDALTLGTFLTLLNLLFAAFCFVQLVFLFSGGYMQLPAGIVYSEYARSGFFQLLFVTLINFTVIVLSIEVFRISLQYKSLRLLLLLLCVFTGILICSSFYRMSLYIQAYNYTVLRTQVLTFLCMESALLAVTILYLLRRNLTLIKYYAYIVLVFLLAVNYTGTHYFADKLNVREYYQELRPEKLDLQYFSVDGASMLLTLYNDPSTQPVLKEKIQDRIFQLYREYNKEYNKATGCWQNYSYYKNKGFDAVAAFVLKKE